jgi:glycosyltransferase involved in cell wall biosynthesis
MKEQRILVIAQTPPPLHGQAIMQKYLVDAVWPWCKKEFVRMNFSEQIDEVGIFKFKKLGQLFGLLNRIRKSKKAKFELAYYPPAGPNRIPIYRDVIILYYLKLVSKKIVLHFHAGGINQIFNKVTKAEASFIKSAFKNVDAVIVLSDWLKKEVQWCSPKKIFVVGNGIDDVFETYLPKPTCSLVSFLFVGNLKKEKGIFTLLKAALILKNAGERFIIRFMGSFHNDEERQAFFRFVEDQSLNGSIEYLGAKSGDDKWKEFQNTDAFCLPTFETEGMPVSILEAMMFQLPVITTNWRGIPDLVRHGENGLLFEPQNETELAACMERLINSAEDRSRMGVQARIDFIQNYTVERHLRKMENVFKEVVNQ